jgi:hypothetical protein
MPKPRCPEGPRAASPVAAAVARIERLEAAARALKRRVADLERQLELQRPGNDGGEGNTE